MKQRFTKLLAALALLVFMMPSVAGWGQTYSLTPDQTSTGSNATSYIQELTEFTYNSITWKMNQWNPSTLQIKTNQSSAANEWRFYNASAIPGKIMQVVIKFSALTLSNTSNTGFMFVGGTSEISTTTGGTAGTWNGNAKTITWTPNSTDNFTFFAFYQNGKVATGTNKLATADAIVVTYETGSGSIISTTITIDDTNLTNFDVNTSTEAGSLTATVKDNDNNVISGATVSWESSDENVATIDANGVVTLVAEGTTTITASYDGDETYGPSSNTYEFEVTDSTPFNGVIFDATEDTGTSSIVKDNVSLACTNGVLNNGTEYRFYKSSTTTINTTDGSTITKIVFTGVSGNPASGFASQTGWTTSGNDGVWVGEAESVSFVASGAQVRATLIKVWVTPNTNLYITASNPAELVYDATSGSISYEIVNYVSGTMVATTSADWISDFTYQTSENGSVGFTTNTNTSINSRSANILLTYTYGDNQTATKEVTVSQAGNPNAFDNISSISAVGADYSVKGTVVATNSRGFVMGDGTGYVYYYKGSAVSQTVGNMITLSGTTGTYGQIIQFTGTPTINAVTSSNYNGTPTATIITSVPDYSEGYHLSTYLQFEGTLSTENSNYFITLGEDQIQISYPTSDQGNTLTALVGKQVLVKGYFSGINSNDYFTVMLESALNTQPAISVNPNTISVTAEGGSGNCTVNYENITEVNANVFFCDAQGASATYNWVTASINASNNVEYTINANDGFARTAYFKVFVGETYSDLVAINQAAPAGLYTEGTIAFGTNGTKISNTSMTGTDDLNNTWNITTVFSGSQSFSQQPTYSQVGASGKPATSITFTTTLAKTVNFTAFSATFGGFSGTTGTITLKVGETTVATGSLNGTNDVTVSINQAFVGKTLTVIVENTSTKGIKCYSISYAYSPAYTLDITGYGESTGGWYLIASPVASPVTPTEANGFISDHYDLYRFSQEAELEWENHKIHSFDIESGHGYLYANSANTTLVFTGTPYNSNGEIQLVYEEGKDFAGWNLIGNPFGVAATLDIPYYRMNENQTTLGAKIEGGQIAAMEGVFVYAYDADEQQAITKATFTRAGRSNNAPQGFVNLNVEQNASVVDNVIVRFDEGRSLPKLQLFKGSAEIFITKKGKDYAIVNSEAQGEMPVNFKAQKNGTYTLNIDTENVEMNYLHLIDNMTGMDVDLLQTPSYTFDATTNDYASRFRLVFSANGMNENGETETFAFFSNGNWVVSNEGEATLQVIDVNGRIVSNETINGTVATSINATPGVYMLRLVNGNEVKTQKIVVK